MPNLRLGLANYWVLLALYAAAVVLSISSLPRAKRGRLFEDPKQKICGAKKLALRLGQVVAFAFVVLISLTPLPLGIASSAIVGIAMFAAGTALVTTSIHYFGKAPPGQPALGGPYRISRNPQWVGLFLALLGLAISSAAWVFVLMVLVVGATYHIQIIGEEQLCLAKYGTSYEVYLHTVPRYLFFL